MHSGFAGKEKARLTNQQKKNTANTSELAYFKLEKLDLKCTASNS